MTKAQRRTLLDVIRRSKGWPVGITVPAGMGHRLVSLGYAEWAPPLHYSLTVGNNRVAIRATTKGLVAAVPFQEQRGAVE
jgi:hypothetical protein